MYKVNLKNIYFNIQKLINKTCGINTSMNETRKKDRSKKNNNNVFEYIKLGFEANITSRSKYSSFLYFALYTSQQTVFNLFSLIFSCVKIFLK